MFGPTTPSEVTLEFGRVPPGAVLEVRNSATTRLRTFGHGQPLRDRRETVDFTTQSEIRGKPGGRLHSRLTTVAKDGHSSLAEMAFPELHQSLDFVTTPAGEVMRAGTYPPTSVFFLPTLPLPRDAVRVGDTWALDQDWISGVDHFPLRLEVIGILAEIRRCLSGHVCADVEVSGHVVLRVPPDDAGARFDSRVRGHALFDVDRGEVIWAEMRSREEITLGPEVSLIESCLVSRAGSARVACEPDFDRALAVPRP